MRIGDELRVWTIRDSGKVKRIRRSGRAQVAPCTLRGKPRGQSVDATARMLPDSEAPAVLDALAAKYGLMGWWTRMMYRFTGDTGRSSGSLFRDVPRCSGRRSAEYPAPPRCLAI